MITRPQRSLPDTCAALTKRTVFEHAGKLTNFTSSVPEIVARLHCDAARMLAGTIKSWDERMPFPLAVECTKHLQAAFQFYLNCPQNLNLLSRCTQIDLHRDASNAGWGAVLISEARS
jgi:hypothetical protein